MLSISALARHLVLTWFTPVIKEIQEAKMQKCNVGSLLVFQIFDDDGDGLLSYQEFIAMMKDRIHRGLKTYSRQEGWEGFKQCIKREMRESS